MMKKKSRTFKKYFPLLNKKIDGKNLVYLDNAATTQKPISVIKAMNDFYKFENANVHRGLYKLAEEATEKFEEVREKMKDFIHAKYAEEIIFNSGTTMGINTIAFGYAREILKRGDCIILTDMEHHANIVPWQVVAKEKKARIVFASLTKNGRLDLLALYKLIKKKKPKILALTHASNVSGVVNPIKRIISFAHIHNALVLIDAAQSIAHIPINVQKLDCDFLVFSGHKMYGPTGVGVLYGKKKLLEKTVPYVYGGHMIEQVTREFSTYAPIPSKLETGTPPIAEVIGLGASQDFIKKLGWKIIQKQEKILLSYALKKLKTITKLKLLGPKDSNDRLGIFSFVIPNIHSHDLSSLMDEYEIAVRAGHHCAKIFHSCFSVSASVRISLNFYNTKKEIDYFIQTFKKIVRILYG